MNGGATGMDWTGWKSITTSSLSCRTSQAQDCGCSPPASMATALEAFNKDRLAHPWNPHVFVVPRLMTYLWRKSLSKDADVMFTVQVGQHFWDASQHKLLIIALVQPLSRAPNYRGPWMAAGTPEVRQLVRDLELGFKYNKNPKYQGLSELDGSLCSL